MTVTDRHDMETTTLERMIAESASPFPARRKEAVRVRVLCQVRRDALLARGRMIFRRAMATVTVTATVLGGVSYAAASSLPGDPLYAVKQASEEVTLSVLPEGRLRQMFLFTVATRRADEIARMSIEESGTPLYLEVMERFQVTTTAAYGDEPVADAPQPSETKLRERVDAAPEPVRERLQQAIEAAGSDGTAPVGSDSGQGVGEPSGSARPDSTGSDAPSEPATGPASGGRP